MIHILKADPEVFEAVSAGLKNFEIRFDDRGYEVGDTLILRQTRFTGLEMQNGEPLAYTGREVSKTVSYILRGPAYGLRTNWVIMSLV